MCVRRFMSQINSILNHFAFLAFCSILAFFFFFFPCSVCLCNCSDTVEILRTHARIHNIFRKWIWIADECGVFTVSYSIRFGNDDDTHKPAISLSSSMDHTSRVSCHTDFNWNWLIFLYRLHDNRELFNRIYWSWSTRSTVSISLLRVCLPAKRV